MGNDWLLSPYVGEGEGEEAVSRVLNKAFTARQGCWPPLLPAFLLACLSSVFGNTQAAGSTARRLYHWISLHKGLLALCVVTRTLYLLLFPWVACYHLGWMWASFQILPFLFLPSLFKIQLYSANIKLLTCRAHHSQLQSSSPFLSCFPPSFFNWSSSTPPDAQNGNRASQCRNFPCLSSVTQEVHVPAAPG